MARYKIGDSVWFKFDNGKKEQKGVIYWHQDFCGYEILGNVDGKVYFVKEDEISGIAPHKRYLEIEENRKSCRNCRWQDKCIDEDPCSNCDGFNHTKWEPKEEKMDYRSFYLSHPIYDYMKKQISTKLESDQMWGIAQPTKLLGLNVNEIYFDDILKEDEPMNKKMVIRSNGSYTKEIEEVIFSGPATIVKYKERTSWRNQSNEKSVVKCSEEDGFSKTTGFLLALVKSFVDKKSWNNILRIIDNFEEPEAEMATAKDVWDSLPQKIKDEKEIERARKFVEKNFSNRSHKYPVGTMVTMVNGKGAIYEIIEQCKPQTSFDGTATSISYKIRSCAKSRYTQHVAEHRIKPVSSLF